MNLATAVANKAEMQSFQIANQSDNKKTMSLSFFRGAFVVFDAFDVIHPCVL